ncbi:MAG: VPLPA-CTERM sorting domain-containing protein [Pseudomonadota bacterium]
MKTLILAAAALTAATSASAVTLYSEDFSGQNGKGAVGVSGGAPTVDTSGVTWTLDLFFSGLIAGSDFAQVQDEAFVAQDTNGALNWLSPVIDISGFTSLELSIDISEEGDLEGPGSGANTDFLNISASSDGGSTFSLFPNVGGFGNAFTSLSGNAPDDDDFGSVAFSGAVDDGSAFQLLLSVSTSAGSERIIFDNIVLTGDAVVAPVPLPASTVLLLGAVAGLAGLRRTRRG